MNAESLAPRWDFVQPRCSLDRMNGSRTSARFAAAVLLAAAVVAQAGCGARKDPVQALVDDLEAAAEDKSADRFRDLLTDDFEGQGGIGRA